MNFLSGFHADPFVVVELVLLKSVQNHILLLFDFPQSDLLLFLKPFESFLPTHQLSAKSLVLLLEEAHPYQLFFNLAVQLFDLGLKFSLLDVVAIQQLFQLSFSHFPFSSLL